MRLFMDKRVVRAVMCLLVLASMSASAEAEPESVWQFNLAPYLWALNMNGTLQVRTLRAHVDQSFSDIWDNLEFGGMLWFEANKGKFSLFGNAVYSILSDDSHAGTVAVDSLNKFGIFSSGAAYEIYRAYFNHDSSFTVEPYAGFRYTLNDTTLTIKDLPLVNLRGVKNVNWIDPVAGARLKYFLNNAWSVVVAADLGGTNGTDHYSYNFIGLLGYEPQAKWKNTSWYLGYRYLGQHYSTGSGADLYNWNMKLYGPMFGVNFAFS